MIDRVAFVPGPPLLVPDLACGAAGELDRVRDASLAVVADLASGGAVRVVVVGSGPAARRWDAAAGGTLRGYGVDVTAGGAGRDLPLSLTIGAYLLDRAAPSLGRSYQAVTIDADPTALGSDLARGHDRTALLVVGDGSAKRTARSPGYLDDRAGPYDDAIAAALATMDLDELISLDPGLASDLWVDGRAAWQLAAAAVRVSGNDDGASWDARLHVHEAPYGVGYLVASWSRAG